MAESAKKNSARGKVAAAPDPGEGSEDTDTHAAGGCPVALCPICAAVDLIQPLNPEVVEHLLKAGRELLLAAKSALDAIASSEPSGDGGSMEKIDIG